MYHLISLVVIHLGFQWKVVLLTKKESHNPSFFTVLQSKTEYRYIL